MSAKDSSKKEIREMSTSALVEALATYSTLVLLNSMGIRTISGRPLLSFDPEYRAALRAELNERIAARK